MSATQRPPGPSPLMLTATQEGMWFAERLNPGRSGYHDAVTLQLAGPLRAQALRAALADCRQQHDALRLRVDEARGRLTQRFDAPAPAWRENDLGDLTEAQQAASVRRRFALDCTEPFDLAAGPLWRMRLLRLAPQEHRLLIVLHHLMTDGWSHGVFLRSLLSRYAAQLRSPAAPVTPAPSFRQWAARRIVSENAPATAVLAREAARRLRSVPRRVGLPGLIDVHETRGSVLALDVSPADLAAFDAACARAGLSRYMGMTGLFAHLIASVSGTPELAISAPVADRAAPAAAGILGCMINTVPMLVASPGGGLAAAAAAGRDAVVSALRLLDVPYRDVVRAVDAPFGTSLADPLTNISCEEFTSPRGTWQAGELTVTIAPRGEFQVRHDLTLSVPGGPAAAPELIYPARRWQAGAVAALASGLAGLVRSFGCAPVT